MSNIIDDAVSRLAEITEKDPLDWVAFDAILHGLENINIYDEEYEDTILSELFLHGSFYQRGEVLAEVVRHFLACGYDLSANGGMNGSLALEKLLWSSYDYKLLDVAKLLLREGACASYHDKYDDPDEEPDGLLRNIRLKLDGAWLVDKDFGFANTLGAYCAIAEASIAGKDYGTIDTYFTCIGKTLTAVSADVVSLRKKGDLTVFSEPLVLWFGDKPLVASCYTDYVVNPVYADDKKAVLTDISDAFPDLIGATLKEVQYMGSTICFFAFSNGMRLIFASRKMKNRQRAGNFMICPIGKEMDVKQIKIDYFCGISGIIYSSSATNYQENAIALFCGDESYLLYLRPGDTVKHQFGICPCSRELLTEYTRQYPLTQLANALWMYEQNNLTAVRLDYPEGFLYMKTSPWNEIDVQLSDQIFDPLADSMLPHMGGKHMEFLKRKE